MKIALLIPPSKFAKNVARDLIYGCWCKGKRIAGISFPPISQLAIVTFLLNCGHQTILLDAAAQGMRLDEVKRLIADDFDFVIVLTSTMTVLEDAFVLRELKSAAPKLKTIVYGAHPTFMPEATLAKEGIDFVILGEPELAIKDLIGSFAKDNHAYQSVKGIGYLDENERAVINERQPIIENIDDLPIPDRRVLADDIHYFNPIVKRTPYTTAFTARGCPGQCTYCSSPSFYGRKIRFRSAQSVLEELEIIQRFGYKEVFFRDEIFTISKKRTIEICEGILKNGLNLSWICSARVGSVDKETMKLMKKSGCHLIRLGVESGVQQILDNIKKGITVEQIIETFKWTHECGLDTHAHLMIGMPGDTTKTIDKTIKFIMQIDPTIVTFGICTPYPGTHLFEIVKERYPEIGDGSQCDLSRLHTEAFFNRFFTELSNKELARKIRMVYRRFYMRPSYMFKWLIRINSVDEFKRVTLAAAQVVDFIFRGDTAENSDIYYD